MTTSSKHIGDAAELAAANYLTKAGYELIKKNFRCKFGEIDLILQQNDTLIFVEVRKRQDDQFGSELESITSAKMQRIIRAAKYYLQKTQQMDQVFCRFDVIGIDGSNCITWIKNAFDVDP